MVTLAQINRLDSRIDELARRLEPERRLVYDVRLVWIQDDGSILDGDGNPYVRQPGEIVLSFEDPAVSLHHGHSHSA
jgi:hypothetical protein